MHKINKSLMERALEKSKSDFKFLIVVAILVLVMFVVVMLNTFVYFNVQVKGASMNPTLYTNDVLVANRYKTPTYGSIIIISGEKENGDWLIKRVIAKGGDTVDIRNGYVYVKYKNSSEFIKLEESYVKKQGTTDERDWQKRTLTDVEIFYLGDNRENSSDSRNALYGTCDISQVIGVVEDWSLAFKGFHKKITRLFS